MIFPGSISIRSPEEHYIGRIKKSGLIEYRAGLFSMIILIRSFL